MALWAWAFRDGGIFCLCVGSGIASGVHRGRVGYDDFFSSLSVKPFR